MSIELKYLALSALLTATLWIPYIISQVLANGFLTPQNYRDPTPAPVPLWGQRANRAHINSVESFGAFAALILIIHITNGSTSMTATWAALYFWARLAHAIVYLLGVPYIRTPIFALSFVSVVGLFWELMM